MPAASAVPASPNVIAPRSAAKNTPTLMELFIFTSLKNELPVRKCKLEQYRPRSIEGHQKVTEKSDYFVGGGLQARPPELAERLGGGLAELLEAAAFQRPMWPADAAPIASSTNGGVPQAWLAGTCCSSTALWSMSRWRPARRNAVEMRVFVGLAAARVGAIFRAASGGVTRPVVLPPADASRKSG